MQDNLINQQTVDKVINSAFGSYEKFILSLIARKKELEKEKQRLLKRLKEIEKEESLIKNVLTGFQKPKEHVPSESQEKIGISDKLTKLEEEKVLLDRALRSFHGKKINGQYYDASNNSLSELKPTKLNSTEGNASKAIADLLIYKKNDYNLLAGKELINNSNLYSQASLKPSVSLQENPLQTYQNEVLQGIQKAYVPSSSLQELKASLPVDKFDRKVTSAFKGKVEVEDFVISFAKEVGLKKVQVKQGLRV